MLGKKRWGSSVEDANEIASNHCDIIMSECTTRV